jgi:hypothetical protein
MSNVLVTKPLYNNLYYYGFLHYRFDLHLYHINYMYVLSQYLNEKNSLELLGSSKQFTSIKWINLQTKGCRQK